MNDKNPKARGEFQGDFSRDTFDPEKNYSGVLMQQGRPVLDADFNEQNSILMHYMRTLAVDMMGEHGTFDGGFKITIDGKKLNVGKGHYYVNGIRCENNEELEPLELSSEDVGYLIYLDVWERHITYVEDDSIREVALGGVDTATRSKVEWRVRIKEILCDYENNSDYASFLVELDCDGAVLTKPGTGKLNARLEEQIDDGYPCTISPDSKYRGAENQLYRVEVHTGGVADTATFKWSRENGSVIFPVEEVSGNTVSVEHLGRDARFGLKVNDWVEIVTEASIDADVPGPLWQVEEVDQENMQVILIGRDNEPTSPPSEKVLYLRRWDHKENTTEVDGAVKLEEFIDDDTPNWLSLENGIQIQFQKNGYYQSGDYWLIPARATGDIEWPEVDDGVLPHGVVHYYAPLAVAGNLFADQRNIFARMRPTGIETVILPQLEETPIKSASPSKTVAQSRQKKAATQKPSK